MPSMIKEKTKIIKEKIGAAMHYIKNRWKQVFMLALAVVLLLGAVYCMLRFGFGVDLADRTGWKTRRGITRYLDYSGKPQTGWQYIDGKLYYFALDSGAMATGWQEIENDRYYFGADGVRMTGWQTVEEKQYYLGHDGKRVTGWQQIDGKSYYFTEDGAMATGWQTVNGKRSYFSDEGMALTGWHVLDNKIYFFTADGYTVSGWVEMDNTRYRFADDGAVVTGWYEEEGVKYYFDKDGLPYSGWLDLDGKRYYIGQGGVMATGWLTLEKDSYYLNADGTVAVGKVEIDGVNRFFDLSGKQVLLTNKWNPVPEDYVVRLASIEGFQFDSVGRDSLQTMLDACREAGFDCKINNTYRSKATQQRMWDRSVEKLVAGGMTEDEATAETAKSTALPGHSEHQTGLAVDVDAEEEGYTWLAEHCWEYGFILRYTEECTEHTAIMYEPWHFRYVGAELAKAIRESGLCMEEYFESITPKAG